MNTGEKGNKLLIAFVVVVLAIFCLLAAFFIVGRSMALAEVSLNGDDAVTAEYGSTWEDPGAEGKYTFPVTSLLDSHTSLTAVNTVDTNSIGEQKITYTFDYWGKHGEATRTVNVVDTVGPEITLVTDPDYYTKPNEEYEEEGFTAVDLHDGDLTEIVKREVTEDKIIYTATDSFGNSTTVEREIPYDDRVAPELTLEGGEEINWSYGIPYIDTFTAIDDVEGDITDKVTISGSVDANEVGDYKLTYEIADAYGNTSKAERIVHVVENPDGRYVYLTFDDGPYQYTERLLDIFDKYNVKATFFITAWYGYPEMIGEEFRRGHSVGVHTYYHKYDEIYSSDAAFWADFERVQELIVEQTGQRTNLMRFPGGSSNGVSAQYNKGIMTRLVKQAEEKGYTYFDWNVSSGDAGETTESKVVAQNIISGIQDKTYSVVLCHDVKEYTVDAMEEVILYCLQNGYTLLPLTEGSPTTHHAVNN